MPNLRDEERYRASVWDWSVYNDCFGDTGIRISDVDGIVERKGHFLFIETKRPGEVIPKGQQILLTALARLPEFHVLVLYGETNQPVAFQFWDFNAARVPADQDRVSGILRRWFAFANKAAAKRQ